jgi:hypothetical protein
MLNSQQMPGTDSFQEVHRAIIACNQNMLAIVDRIASSVVAERIRAATKCRLLLKKSYTNTPGDKINCGSKATKSAADNDNVFGHCLA